MSTTYAQRQNTAQKKDATTAASVLDNSSQSESLQRKAELANGAVQRVGPPRPNNTGMPDNLKAGIESLSGFSMDDVRVHYNSSKPATVQALAYTQGTDIHVAPGQEKHLPHEAWHVAQQMAGRVSPTTNINGMPVNDNAALEHEADVMGEKAVQCEKDNNSICSMGKCNSIIQMSVSPSDVEKTMARVMASSSSTLATSSPIRLISKYVKTRTGLKPGLALLESTSIDCYVHVTGDSEPLKVTPLSGEYCPNGDVERVSEDSKDVNSFFNHNKIDDPAAPYRDRDSKKPFKTHITLEYRYLEAMVRLIISGENKEEVKLTSASTSNNLNFRFEKAGDKSKISFDDFIEKLHVKVIEKITRKFSTENDRLNRIIKIAESIRDRSLEFKNYCRINVFPVTFVKGGKKGKGDRYDLFVDSKEADKWLTELDRV